ncbi:hypothetical protein Tco_1387132 [Tanacetum coccineum]
MRSLLNLFAESRQKAEIQDIMEMMEMVVGWLQSNRTKIDDFLKRYAMSQELKVVQTVVELMLEKQTSGGNTQEAKDKKKGKCNNNNGNNNNGKKINDNAYKIKLLEHYNMSATFDVFDLSPYSRESDNEENSRMSFSQAGEDNAVAMSTWLNISNFNKVDSTCPINIGSFLCNDHVLSLDNNNKSFCFDQENFSSLRISD